MYRSTRTVLPALALFFSGLLALPVSAESIWIEAESLPQKPAAASTGWAKPEYLSGGQVLAFNLDSKAVAAVIPVEGLVLAYPVTAKSAGTFTLWNRVVFEGNRSPFEWRINQGPWTLNSQEGQPITNLQELGFWNPIGWTRLGPAALTAGANTLEIRLTRQSADPKTPAKTSELRYVSDALLLTTDDWQPNFGHAPGAAYQTDNDRAAAKKTFALTDTPDPRQSVALDGLWQFAPYDEIGEISEQSRVAGTPAYPAAASLSWYGLPIPGDRDTALPDTSYSHRFILRTFVDVPASLKSAGYVLDFQCLNLIQTLFVNGVRIGDFDTAMSRWQADVTRAIKPGARNEILLVVKDCFYAFGPSDKDVGLRRTQYIPGRFLRTNQGVTRRFDFPIANSSYKCGILDTATLTATETPVYVADTFVKPFPITKKEIVFETTLRNSGASATDAVIRQSIRSWPDDTPVATVGETKLTVPAGASATASLKTSSAPLTLWWTYAPSLYNLVTEVLSDGKVIDRQITRFGNREWEIRGNQFYLNGVRQHLRNDLTYESVGPSVSGATIVKTWRENGNNMFRRRFQFPWNGKSPRQTLAWMDEVGMNVRMDAGTFDGQIASYNLVQGERADRTARRDLFDRWHAQIMNGVATFKNHPSVFIWEIDNEIVYINARNGGLLDQVEPEFTKTSTDVLAYDPTRSIVSGGGRALRDDSLPTYGVHYFEVADRDYPDEAYTGTLALAMEGTKENGRVWPVNFDKKPIFFSETAFLPGRNAAQFAAFGGEGTFLGKAEAKPAAGLYASWIAEGYRWKGFAASNIYFDKAFTDGSFTYAWQPVAILRRQWNDTFAPGQVVPREFRVYNDLPDTRPITASWTLEVGGKTIATESKEFIVAPGTYETWNTRVTLPATATTRAEGRLILTATRAGQQVFTHDLPVTLLPEPKPSPAALSGELVVWDPSGEALARLRASGYTKIREVKTLAQIPDQFGLLVVGRNALTPADSTNRRWTALAVSGNKILFLEQTNPLHFQAIPADLETTNYDGRMAFSQNLANPIFRGLAKDDLSFWGDDHVVYRHALRKPTHGATSLAQCDDELGYSALLEAPVEQGLLLLSQFAVAEKLGSEVVARQLFDNLVAYAGTYHKVTRPVQAVVSDPVTSKALASIGVPAGAVTDALAAVKSTSGGLVLVQGISTQLAALAAAPSDLAAFWQSGGYLVILDVTPESLASFNKIVGYEHILRPFREELVRFPTVSHPLTAGLTLADIIMSSGKRIQTWSRDEWPTHDAFDFIADLTDIAPFAEFPEPAYFGYDAKGPGDDHWPLNMVNGYTSATHWRMVFSLWAGDGAIKPIPLKLPREEIVTGFSLTPNRAYRAISKLRLVFDGDRSTAQELVVGEDTSIDFKLKPQRARTVTIEVIDWTGDSAQPIVGIDNFSLIVQRPADFAEKVRPLLNIGGLIEYPRGMGGVLLDQYVFRASESNPVNADKKKTLLASLLKNLGADLGGAKTAVAGFNLQYAPVSLESAANLYLTSAQGWFAKGGDLSALPRGANTFAGVRYSIRDFTTSPLESGVTLKHPALKSNASAEEVAGIAVNARVDTLFFLQTFLQARAWKPRNKTEEPPVLFQYVIHYEDGTQLPVVMTLDDGIGNWLQTGELHSLPKAEIAWTGPAAGGKTPTVYQYQWNNPYPAKKITTLDLAYAEKGRDYGAPVLLAVTGARVQQ